MMFEIPPPFVASGMQVRMLMAVNVCVVVFVHCTNWPVAFN